MRRTIYTLLIASAAMLSSCNDYLSKMPNEGANEPLRNSAQIDAIFGNSNLLKSYTLNSLTSSDDFGWTTELMDQVPYPDEAVFNGIVWDIKGTENAKGDDQVWSTEFNRIFYANLIINEIDNVKDLTPEKRTDDLAQAHFLRALANWELASIYCRPYSQETLNSLGLPLKRTTDYEESMERATLADTYKFIEDDLKEALTTTRTDIDKRWLVSRPAVEAMLSRFYLFTCQYDKAVQAADEALKSTVAKLKDFNTLTHIDKSYGDEESGGVNELLYPEFWGYSANEYTNYDEFYFAAVYRTYDMAYIYPSEELLNAYDQDNDLRFDQFFVKGGMKEQGLNIEPDYYYRMFSEYSYTTLLPSAPTVAEVLLNKAEAQARLGQYQEAINTVNLLRVKRMRTGAPDVLLTASSQEDAVKQILAERHREMPFVMRWQDIRRLAYNETAYDDIVPTRTFYAVDNNHLNTDEVREYTLPLKSPRYAQPITNQEISRSGGQLKQNEY